MMYICTILDGAYLLRMLALVQSLETQTKDVHIFALCTDQAALDALTELKLPGVTLLPLADLENRYQMLKKTEHDRERYEYIMTCKPFLIRYVLEEHANIEVLTYLDGDLFFFDDAHALLQELGTASVLLTPHNEPDSWPKKGKHGFYNAGCVTVRNDRNGKAAVHWWCERVAEWCFDRVEGDRFIDQKYLDEMPALFDRMIITQHPGLNVAPWNAGRHSFSVKNGLVLVDAAPLIFYHFHGLKRLKPWLIDTGLPVYRISRDPVLIRSVYRPYLNTLKKIRQNLSHNHSWKTDIGTVRKTEATTLSLPLMASRIRRRQWLMNI